MRTVEEIDVGCRDERGKLLTVDTHCQARGSRTNMYCSILAKESSQTLLCCTQTRILEAGKLEIYASDSFFGWR